MNDRRQADKVEYYVELLLWSTAFCCYLKAKKADWSGVGGFFQRLFEEGRNSNLSADRGLKSAPKHCFQSHIVTPYVHPNLTPASQLSAYMFVCWQD